MNGLYLRHERKVSVKILSGLFGKTREGFYSVSMDTLHQRETKESGIVRLTREIRDQAPGIGAFKLFLILKDIYPEQMMGRDSFYRLMHRHRMMLPPQRRRHTTCSNHNYHKYKNRIKGFVPCALNQLWVADITYVETEEGVCYLHLLTDAFTHAIIGWVLSDSLMATNTIDALRQGIAQAGDMDLSNLIHHSDRGSQYCCNAYVSTLESIGATISMTEDYKPTDNAIAERVNGIIKQEWLYRMKRPKTIDETRTIISGIVDFYNNRRPHMSNGMLTPSAMKQKHDSAA